LYHELCYNVSMDGKNTILLASESLDVR